MTYRPAQPGDAAWDPRLVVHVGSKPTWGHTEAAARFKPDYKPDQMARMGVFGDAYWGDPAGQFRIRMAWASGNRIRMYKVYLAPPKVALTYKNTRGMQCKEVNYFGRPASLKRDWWLDKRLIYDVDPLGWYEWYHWYCFGRRVQGYDDWQIDRWCSFKSRQLPMFYARPSAGGAQALLHWGVRAPNLF